MKQETVSLLEKIKALPVDEADELISEAIDHIQETQYSHYVEVSQYGDTE